MANVRWFKIKSWHIYDGPDRIAQLPKALCGLLGLSSAEIVDERPGNERTCENCLRRTVW